MNDRDLFNYLSCAVPRITLSLRLVGAMPVIIVGNSRACDTRPMPGGTSNLFLYAEQCVKNLVIIWRTTSAVLDVSAVDALASSKYHARMT